MTRVLRTILSIQAMTELTVDSSGTRFRLWSPKAQDVVVNLYDNGHTGVPYKTLPMTHDVSTGTRTAAVPEKLYGKFYTFKVKHGGKWLSETRECGQRQSGSTANAPPSLISPPLLGGWQQDKGPEVRNFSDVIVYEMHHRDMSMHPSSGIANKGKFLALTEKGTTSPEGEKTGIDHLKELGVTHVHILPSYDYNSVDETNLQNNTYNWGMTRRTITHPKVLIRQILRIRLQESAR